MSLFKDLSTLIYQRINAENELPEPVTPENAPIVSITHGANGASVVKLKGVRYSGWKNYLEVKYTRIDLAVLFKNVLPRITTGYGTNSTDIIGVVSATLGIDLTADDIVRHPINWGDPEGDYIYTCVIEMAPNHPLFYGSFVVEIAGMSPSLDVMISVRDYDTLLDTSPHMVTTPGATFVQNVSIVSYGVDYSAVATWLSEKIPLKANGAPVDLSDALIKELIEVIKGVDGQPWTFANLASLYNIRGAKLTFHGPTAESTLPATQPLNGNTAPNQSYDNYILLTPNPTYTVGYKVNDKYWGFYFHYNTMSKEVV